MLRVADERRLPFEVKAPNTTTRKAIAEVEAGKGKLVNRVFKNAWFGRFARKERISADALWDEEVAKDD